MSGGTFLILRSAAGVIMRWLVAALTLALASPAWAQVDHTWVSTTGADENYACTVQFPCATLQRAHDALTTSSGAISVLTPGEYGPLAITKAVSVDNDSGGVALMIPANGGACVTVNVDKGLQVHLRGLTCEGLYANNIGIEIDSAQAVYVERCSIRNLGLTTAGGIGILLQPTSGTTQLFVSDTDIFNVGSLTQTGGIFVRSNGGNAVAVLDRVRLQDDVLGLWVDGSAASAVVRNSLISGNSSYGALVSGGALTLDNVAIVNNQVGLYGGPNDTVATLKNNTIIGNGTNVAGGITPVSVTPF